MVLTGQKGERRQKKDKEKKRCKQRKILVKFCVELIFLLHCGLPLRDLTFHRAEGGLNIT